MRHIFVINPLAGKKGRTQRLEEQIRAAGARLGEQVEIYETKFQGDGERFVRKTCEEQTGNEKVRFYACGGDGALNEVANGAFGFANAEVGCVPLGTGNDYVRNYASPQAFLDIEAQLRGRAVDSDLIRYVQEEGEEVEEAGAFRYCVNMFNIGFDCNVVDQTSRAKNWPLVKGSFAYLLSVAIILIKKEGADLKVYYEDGTSFDGKLLLIAVANGCFCGGGVKGLPLSILDDGLLDVSLIKDVPRRTFIRLFPKYAKGVHLGDKRAQEIIDYRKCRKLTIAPNSGKMKLCVDGEILYTGKVSFEIVPRAMRFSVPAGVGAGPGPNKRL
ncbi:hypothetical protein NE619_11380 [Anaerovorax odorimutans]|uniref:DAGKc domain-containing protein n=1 Tax=Anaerovorax odorimutans TaxID=109327 RepID=A0ABT1RQ51_9FIRM|nr:diacylglycerol kinase family protein [Anaerovorax odorimutans]MCQ4637326.1 hypothetical protein [Anaerovorax odorimutans]